MRHFSHKNKGFSIMEFLIYISILVVVITVATTVLIGFGRAYAKAKAIRAVNQAGVHMLDRITREARKASKVVVDPNCTGTNCKITLENIPATYAEAVRNDGAISHWNFEEKNGDLIDQIGRVNGKLSSLTENGILRNQQAQVGRGYYFNYNGTTDGASVLLEEANVFDSLQEGAIEMVIKPDTRNQSTFQAAIVAEKYPMGVIEGSLWGVGAGSPNGKPDVIDFGAMGSNGNWTGSSYLQYNPSLCGHQMHPICSNHQYPRNKFYYVVVQSRKGIGTEVYVNGQLQSSAIPDTWFGWKVPANWNKRYRIGNGWMLNRLNGKEPSVQFLGIIDELAIYPTPKDAATWASHYQTAFPTVNGGGVTVDKTITIQSSGITIKAGSDTAVPLSSDAVARISDISATTLGAPGNNGTQGLRIQFTVSAGSGTAASSAQFQTIIAPRKQ